MTQKVVGMLEALVEEINTLDYQDKKFVDAMDRRGYHQDFELDYQDAERIEELYQRYLR